MRNRNLAHLLFFVSANVLAGANGGLCGGESSVTPVGPPPDEVACSKPIEIAPDECLPLPDCGASDGTWLPRARFTVTPRIRVDWLEVGFLDAESVGVDVFSLCSTPQARVGATAQIVVEATDVPTSVTRGLQLDVVVKSKAYIRIDASLGPGHPLQYDFKPDDGQIQILGYLVGGAATGQLPVTWTLYNDAWELTRFEATKDGTSWNVQSAPIEQPMTDNNWRQQIRIGSGPGELRPGSYYLHAKTETPELTAEGQVLIKVGVPELRTALTAPPLPAMPAGSPCYTDGTTVHVSTGVEAPADYSGVRSVWRVFVANASGWMETSSMTNSAVAGADLGLGCAGDRYLLSYLLAGFDPGGNLNYFWTHGEVQIPD